ncbi:MAG TPA: GtrA family protein [Burkholderiaceae bacterium]|jgi:putative flippase GtrA
MDAGRLIKMLSGHQPIRFLLAGAVNTLFGLAAYVGGIFAGLPPWLAILVSTVAGVAFNFVSFGGYAFRDLSLRRLPRFLCSYAATYLFNLAAFHALSGWLGSAIWCQVILTPVVALFSYWSMSNFVFVREPQR